LSTTDGLSTDVPTAATAVRGGEPARGEVGAEEVVVLDYGGQYSQLIARRVRECGVFSELLPHHVGAAEVARRRPRGLILSGGPASVYAPDAPRLDPALLELGIPVLGICYGMQLLTRELGGDVQGAEVGEFGRSQLTVKEPGRLLAGLPAEQTCWMSHRDTVFAPPPGFTALASSSESPVAALESVEREIYGIQFHPEVVHTPHGRDILRNFLYRVSGLTPNQEHGFHVHEKGDCSSGDGMSSGGHYNPTGRPHGPPSGEHHVGDQPALKADGAGNATIDSRVRGLAGGPTEFAGKALIVHASPDDYTTQPTGNSGARIACGVIGPTAPRDANGQALPLPRDS